MCMLRYNTLTLITESLGKCGYTIQFSVWNISFETRFGHGMPLPKSYEINRLIQTPQDRVGTSTRTLRRRKMD